MAATPSSMLRIVTQGLQDLERLNSPRGQPSVGFFTSVIRQRTRWASQWRRVEFDNLADFGRKATVTLPIIGELITRATLVINLPDIYTPQQRAKEAARSYSESTSTCLLGPFWSWTNAVGNAICSNATFSIGGTVVDQLDSRLIEVIDEQTGEVEHWDSTNSMIARNPTDYTQFDFRGDKPTQTRPQTLEIVFPFWWNRGPGPQALPIQALAKDKVQITVDFRTLQECIYTDARVNPANPGAEATQAGPLPIMAGCGFYQQWPEPSGGVPIYDITRLGISCGSLIDSKTPIGRVLPGVTMPPANTWHFQEAFWIIEYISLEDREASAYRMADLQIPIEQHIAVPVTQTVGSRQIRVPLAQGGLVRDMTWVAQRTEATDYNAYFLFSRDLGPPGAAPSEIPWWPDVRAPNWDYGDGYLRPGFADRRSDPIAAATLWYRGTRRFEHEGPSFFRSLLPALGCKRTPLIDRYVYRYDFGFWPTGGLAEALDLELDEVRGFANWDKIPSKELALTMNLDDCDRSTWETDTTQPPPLPFTGSQILYRVFNYVSRNTAAIQVELRGAANGGRGAYVRGVIDLQALQRTFGYNCVVWLRFSLGGAVSLLVEKLGAPSTYTWIAVAGSGGYGLDASGGRAATAVAIGFRGDGVQTHEASAPTPPDYGGAGGGRLAEAGVGLLDGTAAPINPTAAWVSSGISVGGSVNTHHGGDGYTGGGSGSIGGGGGGSYVSRYISEVESIEVSEGDPTEAGATIVPLVRKIQPAPAFNIYVWLTTYNMLRIKNGRGALMFSQ